MFNHFISRREYYLIELFIIIIINHFIRAFNVRMIINILSKRIGIQSITIIKPLTRIIKKCNRRKMDPKQGKDSDEKTGAKVNDE